MKPKALMLVILTLILNVLAGRLGSQAQPSGTRAGAEPGLNLLIVAAGDVRLKRAEWSDYYFTTFGAALHRGDLLQPARGATVIVLCHNLTTWTVPAGITSGLANGCPPPPEPSLMRDGSFFRPTRGCDAPLLPYVISPLGTVLLNEKPTLRWNAVPDATSYTVSIRGPSFYWKTSVKETAVSYPGKQVLKPEMIYTVMVEADNGTRSQPDCTDGFSVLNTNEAQRVRTAAERLSELQLPDEAKSFAMAHLYMSHHLVAEAVEVLEALVKVGTPTAIVYRTLGDLYRGINLSRLAEQHYSRALELSQGLNDIEGQALTQRALGLIYGESFNNKNEATQRLHKAIQLYQELGDQKVVMEMQKQLSGLE